MLRGKEISHSLDSKALVSGLDLKLLVKGQARNVRDTIGRSVSISAILQFQVKRIKI